MGPVQQDGSVPKPERSRRSSKSARPKTSKRSSSSAQSGIARIPGKPEGTSMKSMRSSQPQDPAAGLGEDGLMRSQDTGGRRSQLAPSDHKKNQSSSNKTTAEADIQGKKRRRITLMKNKKSQGSTLENQE